MRMLIFILGDEHPGPLISSYFAAFGKGPTLPETSDIANICWAACHSAGEHNKIRGRLSSFQPCLLPLQSSFRLTWIICADIWSLMYPRHNTACACADWTSTHVLHNQGSKWVLLPLHAQISCTVDSICYKPLRLCLHTIAQVSTRQVAVCPGFVDMQTLRYLEILDKWQNLQ